jgi:hypothetical protein
VIEGAFGVLADFEAVDASIDGMKAVQLDAGEAHAFATAALALRYGARSDAQPPAPITAEQLIEARRPEDLGHSVWMSMQRIHENVLHGGQTGRTAQGRRIQTRPVASIDRSVNLNLALAEEIRKLKR